MSPAPARTSRDAILSAARAILEEDGLDAVVMGRVAERVGVRGPSLYKHVADRAALIRAVGDAVTADLARQLSTRRLDGRRASRPHRDRACLPGVRAREPEWLRAALRPPVARPAARSGAIADLARPVVEAMARMVGPDDALAAARTFVAWAHGFVSMELAGAFRLGGGLDEAYASGVATILDGISERATRPAG